MSAASPERGHPASEASRERGHPASLPTDRLLLRRWRPEDRAPFAALNADPEVMEHFPARLTRAESDAFVDRIEAGFAEHGFGLWAVEVQATGEFIGFTGLAVPSFDAPFTPAVEIGWRLARPAWGHGYASEAARGALDAAFTRYGLAEVVSFTSVDNVRSQAVMLRIGMTHDPADDFGHPRLPPDHRLHRHVLWRIKAPAPPE
jgi:RimJ/RimL family protein N-acetyltransferase